MDGTKLFGAQIVGYDGVDKRIDTIAVTQRLGGGVKELAQLELSYAPPYSSANDPLQMAAFAAQNDLSGYSKAIAPREAAVLDYSRLENR